MNPSLTVDKMGSDADCPKQTASQPALGGSVRRPLWNRLRQTPRSCLPFSFGRPLRCMPESRSVCGSRERQRRGEFCSRAVTTTRTGISLADRRSRTSAIQLRSIRPTFRVCSGPRRNNGTSRIVRRSVSAASRGFSGLIRKTVNLPETKRSMFCVVHQ